MHDLQWRSGCGQIHRSADSSHSFQYITLYAPFSDAADQIFVPEQEVLKASLVEVVHHCGEARPEIARGGTHFVVRFVVRLVGPSVARGPATDLPRDPRGTLFAGVEKGLLPP
jgi:hypothetical protein